MSSTTEMLDYLDERIVLAQRQDQQETLTLLQDIRNAVFRDSERRRADCEEIYQSERKAAVGMF